jgi:hypothetical protein
MPSVVVLNAEEDKKECKLVILLEEFELAQQLQSMVYVH